MAKPIFKVGDRVMLTEPLEETIYYASPSEWCCMSACVYEKDLTINEANTIIIKNVTITSQGYIYYEVEFNKQRLCIWEWVFKPYKTCIVAELI